MKLTFVVGLVFCLIALSSSSSSSSPSNAHPNAKTEYKECEDGNCFDCAWCSQNCNDEKKVERTSTTSLTINNINTCIPAAAPVPSPGTSCALPPGPCIPNSSFICCVGLECLIPFNATAGICCVAFNGTCSILSDCCSRVCIGGRCGCIGVNVPCISSLECCPGTVCSMPPGQTENRCITA